MHYHGLSEQSPRKVFVLTTTETSIPRRHKVHSKHPGGEYRFAVTLYQFVQVKPERFFGTQKVWVDETRLSITDAERAVLDGLSKPQYCGDFTEVLHAFEARGEALDLKRIIGYALKPDAATAKRPGWVLEQQGVASVRLQRLAELSVKDYRGGF